MPDEAPGPPWTVPVVYDRALIWRGAGVRFWRRLLGPNPWVVGAALAVAVVGFAVNVRADPGGWLTGVLGTGLAVTAVLSGVAYVVPLRRSLQALDAMDGGHATVRLSDDGFSVASAAGSGEVPWSAITEVWEGDGVWVLAYANGSTSLLPADALPDEARAYLVERVRTAAGRVDAKGAGG